MAEHVRPENLLVLTPLVDPSDLLRDRAIDIRYHDWDIVLPQIDIRLTRGSIDTETHWIDAWLQVEGLELVTRQPQGFGKSLASPVTRSMQRRVWRRGECNTTVYLMHLCGTRGI